MSSLDYWLPFIGIAGGYVFGAMLTWLLLRNRLNTTRARLGERLRGTEKHVAELEAGAANLEQEIAQIRQSESLALKQIGSLEGLLTAEKKSYEEKAKFLNKAEERMLNSFRLVTEECLQEGQEQLSELIRKSLITAQDQKRAADDPAETILPLLHPLANSLDRIESRLTAIEGERQNASQILRQQISRVIETENTETAKTSIPTRATTLPAQFQTQSKPVSEAPPETTQPSKITRDPRPYATAPTPPEPAPTQTKQRMSPSTFMEELNSKPLSSSAHKKTYTTAQVAAAMIGKKSTSSPDPEGLPLVKLNPLDEPATQKTHDVLDEDLGDDFVGFEQIANTPKMETEEVPDPKRAADDLRAALES